VLEISVSSR